MLCLIKRRPPRVTLTDTVFPCSTLFRSTVGHVLLGETVADRLARRRNGFAGHLYAIGPHIGDEAVLIELLGEAHRMAGGEMQLARGFLLKRGGGEGRLRIARLRLGFDRGDTETACLDRKSTRLNSSR